MIEAETRRYIDLQIERLRREMRECTAGRDTPVSFTRANYADEAGVANAVKGDTVGYAVNAGTAEMYGGTVGYAEEAGLASTASFYGGTVHHAEESEEAVLASTASFYGGTVGYAENAGNVENLGLVAGGTNVHLYGVKGNTIAVDEVSGGTGGIPAPDYASTVTIHANTAYTATTDGFVFGWVTGTTIDGYGAHVDFRQEPNIFTHIYVVPQYGYKEEITFPFCYPVKAGKTFQIFRASSYAIIDARFTGTVQSNS